jgi:hypothetical protein
MMVALLGVALPARALVIVVDPEAQEPGAPARKEGIGGGKASAAPAAPPASVDPAAEPAPVNAVATISKSEVTIGEPFTVEVTVGAPAGSTLTFPAEVVTDDYELHPAAEDASAGASPEPKSAFARRYQGSVYQLGEAKVEPIVVKVRLPDGTHAEATTGSLALKVKSLLPKDADEQKLADIRAPLALEAGAPFWIAVAVGVLLLLALAAFLLRRKRPARPEPTAPVVDPATEARTALQALATSGILTGGDYRAYYIALTAIAKRYLERRLGAPVVEMTTAETVAFLRESEKASGLATPMRDLANAADQIKFAKGVGQDREAQRHLEAVQGMVTVLEDRFAPPPAPAKVA